MPAKPTIFSNHPSIHCQCHCDVTYGVRVRMYFFFGRTHIFCAHIVGIRHTNTCAHGRTSAKHIGSAAARKHIRLVRAARTHTIRMSISLYSRAHICYTHIYIHQEIGICGGNICAEMLGRVQRESTCATATETCVYILPIYSAQWVHHSECIYLPHCAST